MPSIYDHELGSYNARLDELRRFDPTAPVPNLTHAALAHSNQLNLLLIGLCSLVEARLFELAAGQSSKFTGRGLTQLKDFLAEQHVLDFGTLKCWGPFLSLYEVRNALVHSYGGLVLETQSPRVREALARVGFDAALVGDRRIRLTSDHLARGLEITRNLLSEIEQAVTRRRPTSGCT